MKISLLTFCIVSVAGLPRVQAENLLTTFDWTLNGSDCSGCTGYAHCGILEFCYRNGGEGYGYRQLGADELPIGDGECLSPGPLIRLRRGEKYLMTLKNSVNEPTNIHTHGLHISGDGNQDDITRTVETTGNVLHYNWDVPDAQDGGTFWYHAHKHTFTDQQVAGGALGMIVVEDEPSILLDNSVSEPAGITEFLQNEKAVMAAKIDNSWTGNGVENALINVVDGEWTRLRVGVSDPGGGSTNIALTATSNRGPNPCESWIIAFDGVYTSSVPLREITTTGKVITGASRIDLAVRCQTVDAQAYLEVGKRAVATLNVIPGPPSTANPFDGVAPNGWIPVRPDHLADLIDANDFETDVIGMTASQINGESWDPLTPYDIKEFNRVYEWTVSSSNAHPFHQHLYHMQVVDLEGCGDHEYREWYDTISASGSCTVRFKTADIGGRCIFHCHVLAHEDNGSMSWINVINGPEPRVENPPVQELQYGTCTSGPGGCGTCQLVGECGTNGVDGCGNGCTVPFVGCSSGDEICVSGQCELPSSCTVPGDGCLKDSECCSGSCSSGKKNDRICLG